MSRVRTGVSGTGESGEGGTSVCARVRKVDKESGMGSAEDVDPALARPQSLRGERALVRWDPEPVGGVVGDAASFMKKSTKTSLYVGKLIQVKARVPSVGLTADHCPRCNKSLLISNSADTCRSAVARQAGRAVQHASGGC